MDTVMIKDIRQGMKNLNLTVIVLEVGNPVQIKEREVRTLKVADATACINLSLWDEPGHYLIPGDIVRLTKAHANVFRNCLTLYSGKTGDIDKLGEFCMVFNEQLNMSEPNMTFESGPSLPAVMNNGGPPPNSNNNGNKGGSRPQGKQVPPRFIEQTTTSSKPPPKINNSKPNRGGMKGMVRPERR
uniref:Putative solute carrier family 35 member c2-like protein n=1 Tax=Panstrongylus megistus TaxID=65343 RepID=A0A069DPL9_9HEMI